MKFSWNYLQEGFINDFLQECVALYLHPQYVFMAWFLVKHRDNFTFTLLITKSSISR
jgi:hypothetical protein